MKNLFFVRTFVVICSLLISCELAHANTIFLLGNNPSDDVNILLNKGETGTTVTGSPNKIPLVVDFTSSEELFVPASGQARVTANPEGDPITNLTISIENGVSYGDLIINPFIGGQCPTCVIGGSATITVQAVSSGGTLEPPATFTYTLGNGNNFLTIRASGGESIVSTTIAAAGGFNDLRQPRISGPFNVVPEPETLSLLGCGLIGLEFFRRRFRRG
jgi:hypothetical protein